MAQIRVSVDGVPDARREADLFEIWRMSSIAVLAGEDSRCGGGVGCGAVPSMPR